MTLRSCPSIRIFPVVGRSTPPSRLSSVVLPQPLGPMMATASPFFTSHVLSRSACTSSAAIVYFLLTLSTRTSTPLCSNILYSLAGPHPRSLMPRVRGALRACSRWHGRRRFCSLAGRFPANFFSLALGPHPQRELSHTPRRGFPCTRLGVAARAFSLAPGPHGHPNAAAPLGTPPSRREL